MISFGIPIYVCTGYLWEPLFFASICLPNYLVFLLFIPIWHNILKDPCKKMKISNLFYNYFLKCTLFSPIIMQTANAIYASAQMLKFQNDFTKPLSLQRDPKDTNFFTLFYFSKILTFYMCFQQNTLSSSWFSQKVRFYYRFDILPLIFLHTIKTNTPNEFMSLF